MAPLSRDAAATFSRTYVSVACADGTEVGAPQEDEDEDEEGGSVAGVASLSVSALRVQRAFERAAKRAMRHLHKSSAPRARRAANADSATPPLACLSLALRP